MNPIIDAADQHLLALQKRQANLIAAEVSKMFKKGS